MNLPSPSTTCSSCGSPAQVARGVYRFRESGLAHVFLVNIDMLRCVQCGNEDPVIPHLNELMSVLALAVVKKPCPLNGEEVRFLRKFLRMTGEQFGRHLGVTKHTVSKWENGEDPVGPQSDRLIRAVSVCLGEALQDHIEEIGQVLAKIEDTLRSIEYKIDPEAEEIQYV
jgi:DNA-binding transcriptional regulator YiaG